MEEGDILQTRVGRILDGRARAVLNHLLSQSFTFKFSRAKLVEAIRAVTPHWRRPSEFIRYMEACGWIAPVDKEFFTWGSKAVEWKFFEEEKVWADFMGPRAVLDVVEARIRSLKSTWDIQERASRVEELRILAKHLEFLAEREEKHGGTEHAP